MVSNNTFTHSFDIGVRVTSLHVFVALERTVSFSEDRPKGESLNLNSLILFGYILSFELYSLDLARELDIALAG